VRFSTFPTAHKTSVARRHKVKYYITASHKGLLVILHGHVFCTPLRTHNGVSADYQYYIPNRECCSSAPKFFGASFPRKSSSCSHTREGFDKEDWLLLEHAQGTQVCSSTPFKSQHQVCFVKDYPFEIQDYPFDIQDYPFDIQDYSFNIRSPVYVPYECRRNSTNKHSKL
jgi:hypothetical protein